MPPVSRQQPRCVFLGADHDLDIIPQAVAYHRMLAGSGSDDGRDEFDDKDDFFGDSDSEDPARRPNTENHDIKEPDSDDDDGFPPFFAIKFNDSLLKSPDQHTPSATCINLSRSSGLWVTEPKLTLSGYRMGFLSQLTQLCVHANITRCTRAECKAQRTDMAKIAPDCEWSAFKDWALVIMSCQAAMSTQEMESPAHTHITTVVSGLCKILKDCRRLGEPFRAFLDGDSGSRIDLGEVSNIIYWMTKIQVQIGVGPTKLGRWNHDFLPNEVTVPWIERAVHALDGEGLGICKNRLWNLASVSDRKQTELPDIISAIGYNGPDLGQEQHKFCTPSKCQLAHLDSTSIRQLHKCDQNALECTQKEFPVDLLETALEMGNGTAWLCKDVKLSNFQEPYIAISHVWSDGTGVGLKDAGTVNTCLFDFFAKIAGQLECTAVWWDALSIPNEPKARSKALNMMHSNYANARHTVVHDNALINFPWDTNGSPCVALVLSTWFTRGWTALELSMSKSVKILFKNPNGGEPIYKDLDTEVLAQSPGTTSRAHWLATTLVNKLRQPVRDVGDLLAILSARSTSWVRDRTVIAALLAGVPDCDFNLGESQITQQVLHYLGKIPYFCLFHGKPTMCNKGPYSWCPATLDDMPVDASADLGGNKSRDLLDIDETGALQGYWYCRTLSSSVKGLKAYGNDLAATVKVDVALTHQERCLLLHPSADRDHPLSLLVIPIQANKEDGILDCRYIGTVVGDHDGEQSKRDRPLMRLKVRLGAKEDPNDGGMRAEHAINTMAGKVAPVVDNPEEQDQFNHSPWEATPDWLEHAKPLVDTRIIEPLQPELKINKDDGDLLKAILTRRKNAALYLVKHGVSLNAMKAIEIFDKLGAGEEACASMKLLGDVYVDARQLREAISVYNFVLSEYFKLAEMVKKPIRPLLCKYALATTFVRAARELSDGELRTHFQMSTADYLDQAKEYLSQILQHCDQRAEARGEADLLAEERQRQAKKTSWQNSLHGPSGVDLVHEVPAPPELPRSRSVSDFNAFSLNAGDQSFAASQSGEHPIVPRAEQARDALRWRRLELNVIADLTILLAGKEKLEEAAETFRKAFRSFGSLPAQDTEAFNLQSPERGHLGFKEKNQRDEQAADVYQRALKRFEVMFHGDHLLIFLTSLHLGVNYLLRSRFASAETNLMRALNGFVSRLNPLPPRSEHSALLREDCDDEHIIIGLTRYYLAVLFRHQNKLDGAEKQIQKAKNIALRFHGLAGQLLELSATHELGTIISQRLRSEQQTDDLVKGADQCFKKVTQRAENWLKGDEANPQRPQFLLAMRRLYFLSFSHSILLDLHYDQLQDEVIQKLQRNLDIYGEAKDSGGKCMTDLKRARDVAECEARRILGQAYVRRREFNSAVTELNVALNGYVHLCGECHLQTLEVSVMYADTLMRLHEEERAGRADPESLLEKTVENYDQTVGSSHPETLLACLKLGEVYKRRHKLAKAEKFCERAHHGFERSYGSGHLLTARASRLLGSVYSEKGMLGKAQEMYGKAYEALSAMSNGDLAITDMETLQAAMDYANVSALIRTTVTRSKAMELYKLASKGFCALGGDPLAIASELIARMRLGALHGEICEFREGRGLIEGAASGFRTLLAQNNNNITRESLEENLLEAELKLAQIKLNELKREKNHTGQIKLVRLTLQETHGKLIKLLGPFHMLSLEAHSALGELFLEGHGGTKPQHSPVAGISILNEVLDHYEPDGKAKLSLGHPKKVRIIDSLVSYYDGVGQKEKVQELNSKLWDELVEAYGFDQAALIIDATSGPKHTARCTKLDRFKKRWRKSSACSEATSFAARLTAVAKLFGHGKIRSAMRVSKTKRPQNPQPRQPYQQPPLPRPVSSTGQNSLDHDRVNSDRPIKLERNENMSQAPRKNSASSLADSPHYSNNSQRYGAAPARDSRNPAPSSDTSSYRARSPSVAASERDPKARGILGSSFANSSLESILATEDPTLKRSHSEYAAPPYSSAPPSVAGSPASVYADSHYEGSGKRQKFFGKLKDAKGKLKDAKGKLKEAGRDIKEAFRH